VERVCRRCKKTYPLTNEFFGKNKNHQNGFAIYCKPCEARRIKEYYELNPEKLKIKHRRLHLKHREKRNSASRRFYAEKKHIIKAALAKQRQTPEGRAKLAARMRKYRSKAGPKIISNLRNRLHVIVKGKPGTFKTGAAEGFVGCSHAQLVRHLEGLFEEGMSWENYGRKKGKLTWHIDHIVPYAHFKEDFASKDPARIKAASALVNHYTNLFPLWGPENLKKKDTRPAWVLVMGKKMSSDLHEKAYGIPPAVGDEPDAEDADRMYEK